VLRKCVNPHVIAYVKISVTVYTYSDLAVL